MRTFYCDHCGAEYAVIELTAPAKAGQQLCLHCRHPLSVNEDATLQFTLLKRPSEEAADEL